MVVEVIEHSFLEASKTNACPNRSICLIARNRSVSAALVVTKPNETAMLTSGFLQ
jgi:hypothetical protein